MPQDWSLQTGQSFRQMQKLMEERQFGKSTELLRNGGHNDGLAYINIDRMGVGAGASYTLTKSMGYGANVGGQVDNLATVEGFGNIREGLTSSAQDDAKKFDEIKGEITKLEDEYNALLSKMEVMNVIRNRDIQENARSSAFTEEHKKFLKQFVAVPDLTSTGAVAGTYKLYLINEYGYPVKLEQGAINGLQCSNAPDVPAGKFLKKNIKGDSLGTEDNQKDFVFKTKTTNVDITADDVKNFKKLFDITDNTPVLNFSGFNGVVDCHAIGKFIYNDGASSSYNYIGIDNKLYDYTSYVNQSCSGDIYNADSIARLKSDNPEADKLKKAYSTKVTYGTQALAQKASCYVPNKMNQTTFNTVLTNLKTKSDSIQSKLSDLIKVSGSNSSNVDVLSQKLDSLKLKIEDAEKADDTTKAKDTLKTTEQASSTELMAQEEYVKYALIGVGALVCLTVLVRLFRRNSSAPEASAFTNLGQ